MSAFSSTDAGAGALAGRVALVSAVGQGIGRATAELFAAQGARVLATDINPATGAELVERLTAAGAEARFVAADLTDEAGAAQVVRAAVDAFGALDVAANIVGGVAGAHVPELHELAAEAWDATVALTLRSCFLALKHEIAYMVDHGGGSIVNVTSLAGLRYAPTTPSYAAAKAGVAHLTRITGVHYAERGIRVNAIAPGVTRTPAVAERMDAERLERGLSVHAIHRLVEPEEQAQAMLWLVSDAAEMVTGHVLPVDGGWAAR